MSKELESASSRERERALVADLRAEAAAVKDCFTRYSIQAMAFAAIVIGFAFRDMREHPLVVFAVVPSIALLMAVCRIGIYKYTTANRNFGYELHLARTSPLGTAKDAERTTKKWSAWMRDVSWEEAVKAWRIVQVTVFRQLYQSPPSRSGPAFLLKALDDILPWLYKPSPDAQKLLDSYVPNGEGSAGPSRGYPWWSLSHLTKDGDGRALYYGGSYLRVTFTSLHLMQVMLLSPLMVGAIEGIGHAVTNGQEGDRTSWFWAAYAWACMVVFLGAAVLILLRWIRDHRRRVILESGLLSIQSCAIVWQAVILAHFRALEPGLPHYTERLADESKRLAEHVFSVHAWVEGDQPSAP